MTQHAIDAMPAAVSPGWATAEIAVAIDGVSKTFHKQRGNGLLQRFSRRTDASGNGQAGGRQPIIAVDSITFDVCRGEIFGMLGPNGSGKSTLVRLISTLLRADTGAITIFGHDVIRDEMAVKRLINRVSVEAAFFKKLSPLENLLYAARLYGVSGSEIRGRSREILGRLGIKDRYLTQPLEDMSRGMQQKVAIARAFLSSPILLLLDEPTTGLDPRSKREVQAFVRELREKHDATIMLMTHDMDEAESLCDRIAILNEGSIIALDTPAGLKRLVAGRFAHEPTLEDVFMVLTGKALVREGEPAEEAPIDGPVAA